MESNGIIAIKAEDTEKMRPAFKILMENTVKYLNEKAKNDVENFKTYNGIKMEEPALQAIKSVCNNNEYFKPEDISLTPPQHFPDIIARTCFGVEVKTTKDDSWKSTGSSIIESTRMPDVNDIYLLFGKLGGKLEFRCKPYEECMYDIAVTHSPRYLINMDPRPKDDTIFTKMGTSYDNFRNSQNIIEVVKKYYSEKSKLKDGPIAAPWWIGNSIESVESSSSSICSKTWHSLSPEEKIAEKSKILILFPEVIEGNYYEASSWLFLRESINNPCFRDAFSAGGKIDAGDFRLSKIFGVVKSCLHKIQDFIDDNSLVNEIRPELAKKIVVNGKIDFVKWINEAVSHSKEKTQTKEAILNFLLKG